MKRCRVVSISLIVFLLLALGTAQETQAEDFPPITEAEWELTEVPGYPDAPAVNLDTRAQLWIGDFLHRGSTVLRVWRRIKVLTPEGVRLFGEVEIPHSRHLRLSDFQGRSALPDGQTLIVGEEAVFRRTSSRSLRAFVTAAAFPKVEVGAILDLTYELSVSGSFFFPPWRFQQFIPVLRSEITFHVPSTVGVTPWGQTLPDRPFQTELSEKKGYRHVKVWLEDLPPVPREVMSAPDSELCARFVLLPKSIVLPGQVLRIGEAWTDTWDLVEGLNRSVGRKSRKLKRKALELETEAGTGDKRAVARTMYRYVRDNIRTLSWPSVVPRGEITVSEVLKTGEGTGPEKALLLKELLELVGIDVDLLWVPDRQAGAIDPEIPSAWWFDKVIVRAHLDGEELVLLDPTEPRLGFGFLCPENEGVPAVVQLLEEPVIAIPMTPAEESRRQLRGELSVGPEGLVSGTMEMELTGHHAWLGAMLAESPEDREDRWQEWLQDSWTEYSIDDLRVEEDFERRRIVVRWSLSQREELVLGDEATFALSRPLGPEPLRFQAPASERRTPVLLEFPSTDVVEVTVSWPEGWVVEAMPHSGKVENLAGAVEARVELSSDARRLVYRRAKSLRRRYFRPGEEYGALRELHLVLSKSDAQGLVLVAERDPT